MKSFKIRAIKPGKPKKEKKKKHFSVIKFLLLFVSLSAGVFIVFSIYVLAQVKNIVDSRYVDSIQQITENIENNKDNNDCGLFGCMGDMFLNNGCPIRYTENRTNIMLLGAGGKEHIQGGGDLTDTIIIISLDHKTKEVGMVSIPRDLWVRPPGYKPLKVNTLYRVSKQFHEDPFIIPKAAIENLLDMPIHYYAYIDFKGFEEVIDALGGIEVNVDKSFTDRQYPDGNFGYMTISFKAGIKKMDGETALQYARSRHGNNYQNSDFARAKRQQKMIQAIKDKVLSFGTLFKIDNIADASGVLYTPTEEIREASYGGQYVLLPDGNNYNIIRRYIEKFLENPNKFNRGVSVAILNGTSTPGLANEVGAVLTAEGFNVVLRDNTYNRQKYKSTILYTKSPGDFYQNLLVLENLTKGKPEGKNPEPIAYDADVVLILGSDYISSLDEEESN